MNAKQAVICLALMIILVIPISVFVVCYSRDLPQREDAIIAMINMFVCVPILIVAYRRWISKIK